MTMEIKNKVRVAEIRMRRSYQFEQYQTQSLEITALVPEHLQTVPHKVCDAMLEVLNTQLTRMQQNPPRLVIKKDEGLNVSDKLWNEINVPDPKETKDSVETVPKETKRPEAPSAQVPQKRPSRGRGRAKKASTPFPPLEAAIVAAAEKKTPKQKADLVTEAPAEIKDLVKNSLEMAPPESFTEKIEDQVGPDEKDNVMSDLTDAYFSKVRELGFEDRNAFIARATKNQYEMWGDVICIEDVKELKAILTSIRKTDAKKG